MRRGVTARHIFNMSMVEDPKAIQVTYKQGNRIVIQKQMDEMEIKIILLPDIATDEYGNIIIDTSDTRYDYSIGVEPPNLIIFSNKLEVEDGILFNTLNPEKYPMTQVTIDLSQQETFRFRTDDYVTVQVRAITKDDKSLVSNVTKFKVQDCLDENILPLVEFKPIIDKPKYINRGNC